MLLVSSLQFGKLNILNTAVFLLDSMGLYLLHLKKLKGSVRAGPALNSCTWADYLLSKYIHPAPEQWPWSFQSKVFCMPACHTTLHRAMLKLIFFVHSRFLQTVLKKLSPINLCYFHAQKWGLAVQRKPANIAIKQKLFLICSSSCAFTHPGKSVSAQNIWFLHLPTHMHPQCDDGKERSDAMLLAFKIQYRAQAAGEWGRAGCLLTAPNSRQQTASCCMFMISWGCSLGKAAPTQVLTEAVLQYFTVFPSCGLENVFQWDMY